MRKHYCLPKLSYSLITMLYNLFEMFQSHVLMKSCNALYNLSTDQPVGCTANICIFVGVFSLKCKSDFLMTAHFLNKCRTESELLLMGKANTHGLSGGAQWLGGIESDSGVRGLGF